MTGVERDCDADEGEPRVVCLDTELTSLQTVSRESVTDYVIRPETSIAALRNAGEGFIIYFKTFIENFTYYTVHRLIHKEKACTLV